MSIGENIRNLRFQKKLTQDELAKKVGVARSMIAQIERGTKALSMPLGVEIAKVLQCDIKELIGDRKRGNKHV